MDNQTQKQFEIAYCQAFEKWATSILESILREWMNIGLPPQEFRAIGKEQIERLSLQAEDLAQLLICDYSFSIPTGRVLIDVRESMEFDLGDYQERNDFLYDSVGVRASSSPDLSVTPVYAEGDAMPKTKARREYRSEIRKWMKDNELRGVENAAKRLGVGYDTLKSIMSNKGEKRYGDETLKDVLKKIGHTP